MDFNLDKSLEGMVLASHHGTHPTTSGLDAAVGHGLSFRDQLINHASEDIVIRDGIYQGSGGAPDGGAAPEAPDEHGQVRHTFSQPTSA
eukprot:COSAG04_NODE_827_length_10036_cov_6.659455_9_plen_89_part_00